MPDARRELRRRLRQALVREAAVPLLPEAPPGPVEAGLVELATAAVAELVDAGSASPGEVP